MGKERRTVLTATNLEKAVRYRNYWGDSGITVSGETTFTDGVMNDLFAKARS
ncbi:MAG: hypothetical protein ACLRZ6_09590 [Lachnospiraceae bacterium]